MRTLNFHYKKVLRLCNTEKVITQGDFYDLMYVNHETMNCDKVYAYYRYLCDERLLIVANFNDSVEQANVITPKHALKLMGLKHGFHQGVDLISGNKLDLQIGPDKPSVISISPHNAVIIKLQ